MAAVGQCIYNVAGNVSITLVCVYVEDKLTTTLQRGIYLFSIMNWISAIGYTMFLLSASGNTGRLQDFIHIYVVTVLVIFLSGVVPPENFGIPERFSVVAVA